MMPRQSHPHLHWHDGLQAIPRGMLKLLILRLLENSEMSGIDLMRLMEERTGGVWRPSPGSVYPLLAGLEHHGMIQAVRTDGRSKIYAITDKGLNVLKNVRNRQESVEQKVRVGPLFWLSLLEPEDRASAYVKLITVVISRLKESVGELTTSQRRKTVRLLRGLSEEINSIIDEMEDGSTD
ncbi:MAG: hypothetical protein DRO93_02735 [Candidatus Thorarchaeota archaeon]|nr:MAG: hypothetical protein DRO93_02735 [Candidatus Thorarchaeota archaeon]